MSENGNLYIALNKEENSVSATLKVPKEVSDMLFDSRYPTPVLVQMAILLMDMVENDEGAPAVLSGAAGVAQATMIGAVRLTKELSWMFRKGGPNE